VILGSDFYARPTLAVARDLIGKVLVHCRRTSTTAGIIVEVEAYIGEDDPACHAAAGRTTRNQPLYGPPGHAYVYLNYGLHHLTNAVTEADGFPAAVLIRALEPIEGLPIMRRRRARAPWTRRTPPLHDHELCRGPGNLSLAMGIALTDNLRNLTQGPLTIHDRGPIAGDLAWGPRIGLRVGTDRPWRATVVGHRSVSGRR
jgi:DNA-3-methyladenine glycosylase